MICRGTPGIPRSKSILFCLSAIYQEFFRHGRILSIVDILFKVCTGNRHDSDSAYEQNDERLIPVRVDTKNRYCTSRLPGIPVHRMCKDVPVPIPVAALMESCESATPPSVACGKSVHAYCRFEISMRSGKDRSSDLF